MRSEGLCLNLLEVRGASSSAVRMMSRDEQAFPCFLWCVIHTANHLPLRRVRLLAAFALRYLCSLRVQTLLRLFRPLRGSRVCVPTASVRVAAQRRAIGTPWLAAG